MCGHCHDDRGHCSYHDYSRSYGRGSRFCGEPIFEEKRVDLEEEKRILERGLREIELRIGEAKS
jgi:hypothetical protein